MSTYNKRKHFAFALLGFIWLLTQGTRSNAQNTPTLSITEAGGSVTSVEVPPAPAPGNPSIARTIMPKIPMTAEPEAYTSPQEVQISTVYKDGFNRAMQSVLHNYSYAGSNPIHFIQPYDTRFQSNPLSFLPYTALSSSYDPNMFTVQRDYYDNIYSGEYRTAAGKELLISNANQRATKTLLPGKSQIGQNRGVTTKQVTNVANEVKMWFSLSDGKTTNEQYYAPGTLFGELTYDSTGAQVLIYNDRDGKIVYRKALLETTGGNPVYGITYYSYDDEGRLKCIITPKASVLSTNIVSSTHRNDLCFQYWYDDRSRVIARRLPGKAMEEFIYDKRDRLVYYRDGILRARNQWSFTLYDPLDRPTVNAVATSPITRADLVNLVNDNSTYAPPHILYYVKNYDLWDAYPQAMTGAYIHSYTYYDNYSLADPTGEFWNTYADELQIVSDLQTSAGAETPARSSRINSQVTGTKFRIFPSPGADTAKTGDWRQTAIYYDDKARPIYVFSQDTYKDTIIHRQYIGSQYDFRSNTLLTKSMTTNSRSKDGTLTRKEMTRYKYDGLTGRLIQTDHKNGSQPWSIASIFAYDEMGRTKRAVLGNYGEVQDIDYDIRGQLLGINGIYAETGNKQGESRTFGQLLRYDYGFTQPRYDGKIAGIAWRGSSTANNYTMAYGYSYDLSGRLKQADFWLRDAGVWANTVMDYSVSNLTYDLNGNTKTMTQKATKPGVGIITMDNLTYTYEGVGQASNKMKSVTDATGTATATYNLGDFQDGNTSVTDYSYDTSGNLSKDLNKGISAISYNYQNKPMVVTFSNGNKVIYSYDATGNKVQERIENAVAGTNKTRDFIGNFVYQNDTLQYAATAVGRSVFANGGINAKEEFFVKDHLGNVRSTIDVYTHPIMQYLASYEIASAGIEGLFFNHHDEIRDDNPVTIDPGNLKSGRLNGLEADRRIGTALLLKVMAGDKIEMNVNTFYENYDKDHDAPVNGSTMLSTIVSTLTAGAGGFPGSESHNPALVDDVFTSGNYINYFQPLKQSLTDVTKPRAYLNYILFDESMRVVEELSGVFQATGNGSWAEIGTGSPLNIPQNGFMAVYLSNETQITACANCSNVYFDQLTVRVTEGKLKEENHYYPHGLPIVNLGSAAVGFSENRKRYQGNDHNKETGLHWMDFHNRQYDPQLGRFTSIDPLAEVTDGFSPYVAMNDDPASLVDPLGLSVYLPFLSEQDLTKLKSNLNLMFGSNNWKLVNNDTKLEFNNLNAAIDNFNKFVESGEGGGVMSVGDCLFKIGNQILATHNGDFDIIVGVATNGDLDIRYDGGLMAEAEVADKKVYGAEAYAWRGRTDEFDGLGGQLNHFFFGGNRGDVNYNRHGYPTGPALVTGTPPMAGRGSLANVGRSIARGAASRGSGTAFRYMSEAELSAIKQSGMLRGGKPGETFFTKDLYKSAASAQNRLALPNTPTIRVEFKIMNNPTLQLTGSKVKAANGMMGKGAEFMTTDPVKVQLINWQPLR